jgi:hypothetical protein
MFVPDMALTKDEGGYVRQNLRGMKWRENRGHLPLNGFIQHSSHAVAAENLAVVQEVGGELKVPGLSRRTALL